MKKYLLIPLLFLFSCNSEKSKIEELIRAKELRRGNLIETLNILNIPGNNRGICTIKYSFTTATKSAFKDSILIFSTTDKIISELIK